MADHRNNTLQCFHKTQLCAVFSLGYILQFKGCKKYVYSDIQANSHGVDEMNISKLIRNLLVNIQRKTCYSNNVMAFSIGSKELRINWKEF